MMRQIFIVVVSAVLLATTPALADWQNFTSPEGGFSVMLPGPPAQQASDDNTPGKPASHSVLFSSQGPPLSLVGYTDYVAGTNLDVKGELQANRDNFVKGVTGASLVQSYDIAVPFGTGTVQGLKFQLRTDKDFCDSIVVIHELRVWELAICGGDPSTEAADADRLFKSFTLIPK